MSKQEQPYPIVYCPASCNEPSGCFSWIVGAVVLATASPFLLIAAALVCYAIRVAIFGYPD